MDNNQVKQIVLAKIGLTDDELRDFLRKLTGFYISLTPKEQKVFRSGVSVPMKEALKYFDNKLTAKELEKFIKSREPKGVPVKAIMVVHCKGADGDDGNENQ